MPDRPAIFLFYSLVPAIDCQDDGQHPSGQNPTKSGMQRLPSKADVMFKGGTMPRFHFGSSHIRSCSISPLNVD